MASKTTLNAANLEALGAERLSTLLMEISAGDTNAKRRLRMELAGKDSPEKLIAEIRKRLTSVSEAETNIGWRSLKAFRADLQSLRQLIEGQVAPAAPIEALALMGQLLGMSNRVLERANDSSGETLNLFRQAAIAFGQIAAQAKPALADLVPLAANLLIHSGYGQADSLVTSLSSSLGSEGLNALRSQLEALAALPEKATPPPTRRGSKWRRNRTLEYSPVRRRARGETVRIALEAIADALGDVDAYIALQPSRRTLTTTLRIAERQLRAGRPGEALTALDKVTEPLRDRPAEWTNLRIKALQADGQNEAAQSLRLSTFHATLSAGLLRDYLKRLPDFDDIEAEDEALDRAMAHPDASLALDLLISWPSLERAAKMVLLRANNINGESEAALVAAADRLALRYPLAATLLLRKCVETILQMARSDRYKATAAAVWETERLAAQIDDFAQFEDHTVWLKTLRDTYRHRRDFWKEVDA